MSSEEKTKMTNPQSTLRTLAAHEALRNQLHNLEETIADLLELNKSLPKGELRDKIFNEISTLRIG